MPSKHIGAFPHCLARHTLVGMAVFTLALAGAAAYLMLHAGQYEATARIEIVEVPEGEAVGQSPQQYYQQQYRLLEAPFLAERVVMTEALARDAGFHADFGLDASQATPVALAQLVASTVTIEPIANSQLVDIVATTPSAQSSARIANAWAEQFLAANYEKRFGDNRLARERLEARLEERRVALEEAEAELAAYANENGIVVLDSAEDDSEQPARGPETLTTSQLSALNQALTEASLRRIEARSALEAERREGDIEGVAALRSRRAEAAAQLAGMRATLGDRNPQVQALEAEIESLDRSLDSDSALQAADRQADYELALREEAELRERFDAARANYLAEQNLGAEYGILRRAVDTNRELYEAMLQRYTRLDADQSEAGTNNIALIERARPPRSPAGPSLGWSLPLAVLVAALLASAVACLVDYLQSRPRRAARMRG